MIRPWLSRPVDWHAVDGSAGRFCGVEAGSNQRWPIPGAGSGDGAAASFSQPLPVQRATCEPVSVIGLVGVLRSGNGPSSSADSSI